MLYPNDLVPTSARIFQISGCKRQSQSGARQDVSSWKVVRWESASGIQPPWQGGLEGEYPEMENVSGECLGPKVVPVSWRTVFLSGRGYAFSGVVRQLKIGQSLGFFATPFPSLGLNPGRVGVPRNNNCDWYSFIPTKIWAAYVKSHWKVHLRCIEGLPIMLLRCMCCSTWMDERLEECSPQLGWI